MSAIVFVKHLAAHGSRIRQSRPGQWSATCPAHEDRHPSMTVAVGTRHPVAFQCHAGCDPGDILDALGLTWADVLTRTAGAPGLTLVPCCSAQDGDDPDAAARRFAETAAEEGMVPVMLAAQLEGHGRDGLPELRLPPRAGKVMRAVAADLLTIAKRRYRNRDRRAIPYAGRFGAERLDLDDSAVRRALRRLEQHGTISKADPLPPTAENPGGCPTWTINLVIPCPTNSEIVTCEHVPAQGQPTPAARPPAPTPPSSITLLGDVSQEVPANGEVSAVDEQCLPVPVSRPQVGQLDVVIFGETWTATIRPSTTR